MKKSYEPGPELETKTEYHASYGDIRSDLFEEAHKAERLSMPKVGVGNRVLAEELPVKLQNPLDTIANLSVSRHTVIEARRELEVLGMDPKQALTGVMENVRVLGLGETHIAPNPQRELGAATMKDLKSAGATHLAIEMDQAKQAILDKYMESGKIDPKDLPEKLQTSDYLTMLNSARAAGLKISAVDDHFAEEFLHINRNQTMAAYVGQILEESPKNKVVFWVGSAHLTRFSNGQRSDDGASSAEILSQKYSVATVLAEARLKTGRSVLESITTDLTEPVIVKTSNTPTIGALREDAERNPKTWLNNYDYVIDFPEKKRF